MPPFVAQRPVKLISVSMSPGDNCEMGESLTHPHPINCGDWSKRISGICCRKWHFELSLKSNLKTSCALSITSLDDCGGWRLWHCKVSSVSSTILINNIRTNWKSTTPQINSSIDWLMETEDVAAMQELFASRRLGDTLIVANEMDWPKSKYPLNPALFPRFGYHNKIHSLIQLLLLLHLAPCRKNLNGNGRT